jgi:predicted nucleic acid-binding protein
MKPTVYIETTIVSYLTAWPSRDLVRAAEQQITRDWWETRRDRFELVTSELVLLEAGGGDPRAAQERLAVLRAIQSIDIGEEAQHLAAELVRAGAVPATELRDALHIAVCATNGVDYLLTWNCAHLANAQLRARIDEVCVVGGFRPPGIATPRQLSDEDAV